MFSRQALSFDKFPLYLGFVLCLVVLNSFLSLSLSLFFFRISCFLKELRFYGVVLLKNFQGLFIAESGDRPDKSGNSLWLRIA